MSRALWLGLLLTLCAGLLSGNCMLPMKFTRRWAWENTWLVFSVVSLLVIPWGLAFTQVPDIVNVYRDLPPSVWLATTGLGAGWGIAQVLFGLSMVRLGLALGYAIIVGLGAVLGTLVPLFVQNRDAVATGHGALILCGVAIMVMGIAASARAGRLREGATRTSAHGGYRAALALALLCGLMAPMLNFAFAFGQSIAEAAVRQGTAPEAAGYAVWPVALLGGLVPNVAWSVWLLSRNGTWSRFRGASLPDAGLACLMAALWMGAFAVYGVGSFHLGKFGTSAGWALFQISMIITANVSGVLTGEWKSASTQTKRGFWAGLALLALATVTIASGNLNL
jgi:L-rhamnose-H+ transport protein